MKTKPLLDTSKSVFENISLSYQCIQVLLGSLLGDGSLKMQKNYKNARFQIRHTILQQEYLCWKADKLKEIALPKLINQKADGFSQHPKIALQSRALPSLTKIHAIAYQNNKLNIQRNWLNTLDALALLVWYLDDGSLVSNGKRGCLCTDGFSFSSQKILQEYLSEIWEIETTLGKRHISRKTVDSNESKKVTHYRLYLSNSELRKFFSLIMPLLQTEIMVRKFALKYKDVKYKQRWISTMKQSMPDFHQKIDELYS